MAREKVSDADADADNIPAETGEAGDTEEANDGEEVTDDSGAGGATSAKKKQPADTAGKATKTSKAGKAKKAKKAPESATARRAAEARAAMQHQHRRIDFVRAAAVGVEAAGAAGAVVAGMLAWDWNEWLWGRTDGAGLTVQIGVAIAVLALVGAWLVREDWWRICLRTLVLLAAAAVGGGSVVALTQAETGGRGPGGGVAAVAAVLLIAGVVGWLLGLQRLRKMFAFGVGYARARGYGNLPAVRRARLVGGPVGAVGAAVVVTGALLVVPGLVTTEDSDTATGLVLDGELPTGDLAPSWEVDLVASPEQDRVPTTQASSGGLVVDENRGVRVVDPSNGEQRWHWRDEAYIRAATVLVGQDQDTVVLALEYDGDQEGRDRLVGLDVATGEVRWDRFGDDVVAAVARLGAGADEADWLGMPDRIVVPEQPEGAPVDPTADPAAQSTSHGARVVDTTDGQTRWQVSGTEGCQLQSLGSDDPDVLVMVENCPLGDGTGASTCQATGLDATDGSQRWSWPNGERIDPDQQYPSGCRVATLGGLVLVSYQVSEVSPEGEGEESEDEGSEDEGSGDEDTPADPPVLALDPGTGEEVWAAEREEDSYSLAGVDGLNNAQVVAGDTVLGTEWPSGQPGQGQAVLIQRSLSDGSKVGEVELPEGAPIGVRGADDTVLISHYRQQDAEVLLLEVDLTAGEVTSQTRVVAGTADAVLGSAGLAVGPGTVAVDTLIAPGQGGNPEDVRLVVHGFG